MSRPSSPIVLRSGVTQLWENTSDVKVQNVGTFMLAFQFFRALMTFFRWAYNTKGLVIDIRNSIDSINAYITTLDTSRVPFNLHDWMQKKLHTLWFSGLNSKLTALEVVKSNSYTFFTKKARVKFNAEINSYLNIIRAKTSRSVSSDKLNGYLKRGITQKTALAFNISVKDFFTRTIGRYAVYWREYITMSCKEFWFASKKTYFESTLKVLFVSSIIYSAETLAKHIAAELRRMRKHNEMVSFIEKAVETVGWYQNDFGGVRVMWKGCIQDSLRTRTKLLDKAQLQLATFNNIIACGLDNSNTAFGSLGVRSWYPKGTMLEE